MYFSNVRKYLAEKEKKRKDKHNGVSVLKMQKIKK